MNISAASLRARVDIDLTWKASSWILSGTFLGHPVPSIQVKCTNHCKHNSSGYPHHYYLSVRPNQCRWSDRLLTNNPSIVAPATFLFAPKLRPIAPKLRAGHTAGSSAELPLCLAMLFLPSTSATAHCNYWQPWSSVESKVWQWFAGPVCCQESNDEIKNIWQKLRIKTRIWYQNVSFIKLPW